MTYSKEYLDAVRESDPILAEELEMGRKKHPDYNIGTHPYVETRSLEPDEVERLESWLHGSCRPAIPP
jgi:hypothetical protein